MNEASPPSFRIQWPTARPTLGTADIKTSPADFYVAEQWPAGVLSASSLQASQGEHWCLHIEKTGDNTRWFASALARHFEVDPLAVGFSGMKDRHAVTRQWFSVQLPGVDVAPLCAELGVFLQSVGAKLLASCRRSSKLRPGEHSGNFFRLILRQVVADKAQLSYRLQQIAREGFPNYFGPQRFGHQGDNLLQAARLNPRKIRGRSSHSPKQGLYFSAARAWFFNEWLAQRIQQGNWRECLAGDPAVNGLPSGPLPGDGGSSAESPLREAEVQLLSLAPQLARLFSATRMRPERRALVCLPQAMQHRWLDEGALEIEFSLPTGAFATALLAELLDCRDASVKPGF